jgi:hypothetical protein
MQTTPYSSYSFIDAHNRLCRPLQLPAIVIPQLHCLSEYLHQFQILDAQRLGLSSHVMASYARMLFRSRRHGDFDLGVLLCELRKRVLDELVHAS